MDETKTIPLNEETKQAQEKGPMNREQRRVRERMNKEITDTIDRLVRQWYDFFMDNDPESQAVKDKQKEVSAKWRLYCKKRHLKAEAYPIIDKTITELMEEYKTTKAE